MRYKLRAECFEDVSKVFEVLNIEPIKIIGHTGYPDVSVIFDSNNSLSELVNSIREIEDSHVMYQTLQLEENYSGERNYELN